MRTIWKWQLETADRQTIVIPRDARILCVQTQRETPCLWAEVDPSNSRVAREIRIHGTGHPIERGDLDAYVGTYQLSGGEVVFHVYDGGELASEDPA